MKSGRLALIIATFALAVFVQAALAADPLKVRILDLQEQPGSLQVTVNATGPSGRTLSSLTAANFRVSLDDTPLKVRGVRVDGSPEPVSVLLLVDVSGSMYGDPIAQAKDAMRSFIASLQPGDSASLVTFSTGVRLVQGFTTNLPAVENAIGGLQAGGETSLYDAVTTASKQASNAPTGQRVILLLSDGESNMSSETQASSIAAAQQSNATVIAVALGSKVDSQYLEQLTAATDGSLIEAATAASLQEAYQGLATAIRSQYTLDIEVPASVDRSVAGTLRVQTTYRADTTIVEYPLEPLAGAVAPPITLSLAGLTPGQKLQQPLTLAPSSSGKEPLAQVTYSIDGTPVTNASGATGLDLDPALLAPGSHTLTVQATDAAGRQGSLEVPFFAVAPPTPGGGFSLPLVPILALLVLIAGGIAGGKFVVKRARMEPSYVVDRVRPWAEKSDAVPEIETNAERQLKAKEAPEAITPERLLGRLVVMNEDAVKTGKLDAIREYEIHSSPLTLGTGLSADIPIEDSTGAIAAEEARIWVQRGRLVYHKLTTLSAMATEGVTAGWQFLEDGEEMRLGAYRLVFQREEAEPEQAASAEGPQGLPQEHGMSLQSSFQARPEQASISKFTDSSLEAGPAADPFNREETPPHDSTAIQDERDYRSA